MPQVFPDIQWTTLALIGAGDGSSQPLWTTTGNNDNRLGNGVGFLRVRRSSGFVVSNLVLQIGSSTTFGTGAAVNWEFSFPINLYAGFPSGTTLAWGPNARVSYVTAAAVYGVHGSTAYGGSTLVSTQQGVTTEANITTDAPIILNNAPVTNTAPWTWAANDLFVISWAAEAYGI